MQSTRPQELGIKLKFLFSKALARSQFPGKSTSSLEVCSVSLMFKPLLSGPLISQLLSYYLLVNFDSSFFLSLHC